MVLFIRFRVLCLSEAYEVILIVGPRIAFGRLAFRPIERSKGFGNASGLGHLYS